jgi:hypothetical protein
MKRSELKDFIKEEIISSLSEDTHKMLKIQKSLTKQ